MTITHDQALLLLHTKMQSANLRRHCYSVEAVMRALAQKLGGDPDKWAIVGLLHDGDYEITKDDWSKHTLLMVDWLKEMGETDDDLLNALKSHNYVHTGQNPPNSPLEWALYCCDELTGFIVAVALVRPDKKLASVDVDSVIKKFSQKEFAKAVNRDQIAKCEEKLGLPLRDFVSLTLDAMKAISQDLGL